MASFQKASARVISKVAMVVLAVSVVFYTSLAASAELRGLIYGIVFTHTERYTEITMDNTHYQSFVDSEIYAGRNHVFAPQYIPEGFTLLANEYDELMHMVEYHDDSGGYVAITQFFGRNTFTRIDTENADAVEKIYINSSEALFVDNKNLITIIWRIGDTMLDVTTTCNRDEAIKIAQSIKLMK